MINMPPPRLITERLILRSFTLEDVPELATLLNTPEIAANTLNIAYPYEAAMAVEWINGNAERYANGDGVNFAITLHETGEVCGSVGLVVDERHRRAEMGYWTAVPLWGKGYATEAAQAVVNFGFETLGLNKIYASHFLHNPASGRVMQKIGMTYEGILRQHLCKGETFYDIPMYSILKSEWESLAPRS
jgi:[ribosomal protein S5]-alanine N-acetyltransferase